MVMPKTPVTTDMTVRLKSSKHLDQVLCVSDSVFPTTMVHVGSLIVVRRNNGGIRVVVFQRSVVSKVQNMVTEPRGLIPISRHIVVTGRTGGLRLGVPQLLTLSTYSSWGRFSQ